MQLQEEIDRLRAENAQLRQQLRSQFADLDAAEIVTLLFEQCDPKTREAVIAGLTEKRGVARLPAPRVDDDWPLVARADESTKSDGESDAESEN